MTAVVEECHGPQGGQVSEKDQSQGEQSRLGQDSVGNVSRYDNGPRSFGARAVNV